MGATRELAFTLPWAIMNPTAIFRGIREEGEPDWFCYCAVPSKRYDYRTGESRLTQRGRVFVVYVDADRIIYNWRWEPADASNGDLPQNYTQRFDERTL